MPVLKLFVDAFSVTVHVTEQEVGADDIGDVVCTVVVGPVSSVSSSPVHAPSLLHEYCAPSTFASHRSCALARETVHSSVVPIFIETTGVGSGMGVPRIETVGSAAGVWVAVGVTEGSDVGVAVFVDVGVTVAVVATVDVTVDATVGLASGVAVVLGG